MTAIVKFGRSEHGEAMLFWFNAQCPSVTSAIEFAAELLAKDVAIPESIVYRDKKGDDIPIWSVTQKSNDRESLATELIALCDKYGTRCPLLDKSKNVVSFKGYPDSMNGPAGDCPWWGAE